MAQFTAGAYVLPPSFVGSPGPYVVPLTFHVIRTSGGTSGIPQSQLDQAMIDANSVFAPSGIEFCLPGPIDYIDSDFFYFNISGTADINMMRTTNTVPDTINIYFTENLPGLCGISAFTFSTVQGIAMANSCTGCLTIPPPFPTSWAITSICSILIRRSMAPSVSMVRIVQRPGTWSATRLPTRE